MRAVVIAVFSIIFIVIAINLFLTLPFVWPDESIYADVAQNILHENRIGTDLWAGLIPGIEKCLCWYPPLLFYLLAGWFKLFGATIISQRMLSLTISAGVLITIYFLAKLFLKSEKTKITPWFYLLPILLLMIDYNFSQASRLGRPEIFILLFGSISLVFFTNFTHNQSSYRSIMLAGIFAGLAFMTHFIGIFFILALFSYLIITKKLAVLKSPEIYVLGLSFLAPILVWLPTLLPNIDIAKEQFNLVWFRKTVSSEENWMITIFSQRSWSLATIYLGYMLTSVIFLIDIIVNHKKKYLFLGLTLIFAWVITIYGRMLWYFVLPIPFVYLAFSLLLFDFIKLPKELKTNTKKFSIMILMSIGMIVIYLNLQLNIEAMFGRSGDKFSYQLLTTNILNIIPDKKSVFLSSVPDLYFGFKENSRKNVLFEFPPGKRTQQAYADYLNKADFAIFAGAYDWPIFGNFLPLYLEINQLKTYTIEGPFQNEVLVIELKPKAERVSP